MATISQSVGFFLRDTLKRQKEGYASFCKRTPEISTKRYFEITSGGNFTLTFQEAVAIASGLDCTLAEICGERKHTVKYKKLRKGFLESRDLEHVKQRLFEEHFSKEITHLQSHPDIILVEKSSLASCLKLYRDLSHSSGISYNGENLSGLFTKYTSPTSRVKPTLSGVMKLSKALKVDIDRMAVDWKEAFPYQYADIEPLLYYLKQQEKRKETATKKAEVQQIRAKRKKEKQLKKETFSSKVLAILPSDHKDLFWKKIRSKKSFKHTLKYCGAVSTGKDIPFMQVFVAKYMLNEHGYSVRSLLLGNMEEEKKALVKFKKEFTCEKQEKFRQFVKDAPEMKGYRYVIWDNFTKFFFGTNRPFPKQKYLRDLYSKNNLILNDFLKDFSAYAEYVDLLLFNELDVYDKHDYITAYTTRKMWDKEEVTKKEKVSSKAEEKDKEVYKRCSSDCFLKKKKIFSDVMKKIPYEQDSEFWDNVPGMNKGTVASFLKASKYPGDNLVTFRKIAYAMGVSLDWLLFGKESEKQEEQDKVNSFKKEYASSPEMKKAFREFFRKEFPDKKDGYREKVKENICYFFKCDSAREVFPVRNKSSWLFSTAESRKDVVPMQSAREFCERENFSIDLFMFNPYTSYFYETEGMCAYVTKELWGKEEESSSKTVLQEETPFEEEETFSEDIEDAPKKHTSKFSLISFLIGSSLLMWTVAGGLWATKFLVDLFFTK